MLRERRRRAPARRPGCHAPAARPCPRRSRCAAPGNQSTSPWSMTLAVGRSPEHAQRRPPRLGQACRAAPQQRLPGARPGNADDRDAGGNGAARQRVYGIHRHHRTPRTDEPTRRLDQPLSPPARRQSGRLVAVDTRGLRRRRSGATSRSISRSATPPATGATSWRARASATPTIAGAPQPRLRHHQGRSRGAAGGRPDLYARAACARRAGRLAAHDVPDAGRRAVLGRHLFSARAALRPPELSRRSSAASRRPGQARRRRGHAERRRASRAPRTAPVTPRDRRARSAPSSTSAAQTILVDLGSCERGSFKGAPKFPNPVVLDVLWRACAAHRRRRIPRRGPRRR